MDDVPGPDARTAALQEELRDRHASLGRLADGDVDRPEVDALFDLTAQLLDAEQHADERREDVNAGITHRIVAGTVLALVVAAAAMLVAGLTGGWLHLWGVVGVALVVVVAVVLAAADLIGPRPGSLTGRLDAGACLVGGAALLVAAAGVLPWWGVAIALVLAAVAVAHCLGLLPDLTRRPAGES
jgi:hypothetical protein